MIVTVPETPATQGLIYASRCARMKPAAGFINVGYGTTVQLDVFQVEPLPVDPSLWNAPGTAITPHVPAVGPHRQQRRIEVFVDNCRRFAKGRELWDVVDKANWF